MIVKVNNKALSRYPIKTLNISPSMELRYWIIDNEYHVALWENGKCIVTDNDKPIRDVLSVIIKIVDDFYGAKLNYLEEVKNNDKLLETINICQEELGRVKRQRNYYNRLLKEKNQRIKNLEKHISDSYNKTQLNHLDLGFDW